MGLPFANVLVLAAGFQSSCALTAVLPVMRSWVLNQGAAAMCSIQKALTAYGDSSEQWRSKVLESPDKKVGLVRKRIQRLKAKL
jgi:hypothetical protein